MENQNCVFTGCGNVPVARQHCNGHYLQQSKGITLKPIRGRILNDSAPIGFKTCRICLVVKPHEEFHNRTSSPDGKALYCKPCESEKKRITAYGLSNQGLLDLLNEQNGECNICKRDIILDFVVDHDHTTGTNRGLLCSPCILMLGLVKDNPETLLSAINYLTRWKDAR